MNGYFFGGLSKYNFGGSSKYKFKTLEHNGVIFHKNFKPKGRILANETLSPLAEEMLYNYTSKLNTIYITNQQFNKNFYQCLKSELTESQKKLIFPDDYKNLFYELEQDIQDHKLELEKTKEERKIRNEELKNKYGYAYVDGIKEPLGNYIVEPPGIYIGRGDSSLIGLWKYRVNQEDITLNFVSDKPEPIGSWKIEHNRNVLYIAVYYIDIGHKVKKRKEIRFGNKSSIITEQDKNKFKMSKKLLIHWDEVQNKIMKDLPNKEEALIAWLIQYTSIRIGTEKKDNENNVVGASTLKTNNIIILSESSFKLKFIGKDSIEFCETYINIDKIIIESLNKLLENKSKNDKIFSVSANDVNIYLNSLLKGLTAKVFRTAWASKLLIEEFKGLRHLTIQEFKEILLKVSKKLNHKKTVTKSSLSSIDKLNDKIKLLEEKIKLSKPKQKKKIKTQIKELKQKLKFKKDSIDININTALTNYINPVLIFDICKRFNIDISKIYNKGLLERFNWVYELIK